MEKFKYGTKEYYQNLIDRAIIKNDLIIELIDCFISNGLETNKIEFLAEIIKDADEMVEHAKYTYSLHCLEAEE